MRRLPVLLLLACSETKPTPSPTPSPAVAAPTIAAMPRVGDRAPDFTAAATDGRTYTLSALAGHPVVVYFYPKADTPG